MADPETREALARTILLCRHQVLGRNRPSDDAVADALLSARAAIVADRRNLSSLSCQTSVSVLTRLLTSYGCSVALVMPEIAPSVPEPRFDEARELGARLQAVAADGLPGPVVRRAQRTTEDDVVFLMGDSKWSGEAAAAWRLDADAWSGGIVPVRETAAMWDGAWPLGGIAATLAASVEPFKRAMRRFASALSEPLVFPEQLAPCTRATVRLAMGSVPDALALRGIDAVSGGAIIQAALDTLLRLPDVSADVRVFEPQIVELSNLNRYPISRRRDLQPPQLKIAGLEEAATPTFRIRGVANAFDNSAAAAHAPIRDRVLVGADNLEARWCAQRQWPAWLGVGATADFLAMVTDHAPSGPCAGCAHPFDDGVRDVIPTISFVSYWAGLLLAVQLIAAVAPSVRVAAGIVTEVNALRLDGPTGFRRYPLARHPSCPLACHAR